MRYLKEVKWEVIPSTIPKVKKSCSKCGQEALFQNSEKFRVNANKNKIDVWLIYQCEKCKTTWNMTIHERIPPKDIPNNEYERFMNNDIDLAKAYGFNKIVHARNKVRVDYESVEYDIVGETLKLEGCLFENPVVKESGIILIEVHCKKPFGIRLEKVLSQKLGLSRSKIKKMCKSLEISGRGGEVISKEKLGCNNFIEIKLGEGIKLEIK